MNQFNEIADLALRAITKRAKELNMKGTAIVAVSEGDPIQSWTSKMLVLETFKKVPAGDEPAMNTIAVAYSKAAEMADTLQASGSGVRPPLIGEYGWPGGVVARGKTGFLFAAFSGGPGEDDAKAAQAGLTVLLEKL
jgi:hypothetical protein